MFGTQRRMTYLLRGNVVGVGFPFDLWRGDVGDDNAGALLGRRHAWRTSVSRRQRRLGGVLSPAWSARPGSCRWVHNDSYSADQEPGVGAP